MLFSIKSSRKSHEVLVWDRPIPKSRKISETVNLKTSNHSQRSVVDPDPVGSELFQQDPDPEKNIPYLGCSGSI
jgi:hypothetical protein